MKAKKIILLIVGGIITIVLITVAIGLINDYRERSKIENGISQITEAIENKQFTIADSIYNEIEWQFFRIKDGEVRLKECKQNLERARFRFEVDSLLIFADKDEIHTANQKFRELLLSSVDNHYLSDDEKDYLMEIRRKVIQVGNEQMKPYLNRAKQSMINMRIKADEFASVTWYTDKSSPQHNSINGFYLYFGEKESVTLPLRLAVQYHADNWLFHDKLILLVDEYTYTLTPNEVKRDNGYDGIWEWSDQALKDYILGEEYMIMLMVDIINSNETKIKFIGDNYYDIRVITKQQKEALRNVLLSYVAKGKYIKEISEIVQ